MVLNTKGRLEDEMAMKFSYMDKKLQAIGYIEKDIEQMNQKIENNKKESEEIWERLQVEDMKLQSQINRVKDITDRLAERLTATQMAVQNCGTRSKRNSVESSSKKKIKRSEQSQFKSQCYLNIVNRIDQVQSNIANQMGSASTQSLIANPQGHQPRRSIVSNNKIIKNNNKSSFAPKKENRFIDFQNNIFSKLQKIEVCMVQKLKAFQKEQYLFTNKAEIVDEHIGILSRKLQKEKNRINEVCEVAKTFEDRKIDEKVIENLKSLIKKNAKQNEQNLQNKIGKDVFDKQKHKIQEKINFIGDMIMEKAEKS